MVEDELVKLLPLNRSCSNERPRCNWRAIRKFPLRTLDALHVATCDLNKCETLSTTDNRMRAACEQFAIALNAGLNKRPSSITLEFIMPDEMIPNHTAATQRRRLSQRRKDFQNQRRGRNQELVPRLLDVRHHFPRAAGCARRPEAVATPHSLRDADLSLFPGRKHIEVRQDLRRHLAVITIRTAKRSFTRRSSTWRSPGRCANGWSTARAISARSKAIHRRPCVIPRPA